MLEVLLVEDFKGDVILVREAVESFDLPVRLHVVDDGEDALTFLRREGEDGARTRPGLVLLDANTPRRGALEVLAVVRADPTLRDLNVVVFSSSAAPRDVAASVAAGATAYVSKPMAFDEFVRMVHDTLRTWAPRLGS